MSSRIRGVASLLCILSFAPMGAEALASVSRSVTGGALSVQRNSGEFKSVSPLLSVKAELVTDGSGSSLKALVAGKELLFRLNAPKSAPGQGRVFEGQSDDGLKVVLRDQTTCELGECQGPLWRAEIVRMRGDEELGELALAGDATIYPEKPEVEATAKIVPARLDVKTPEGPEADSAPQAAGSVAAAEVAPQAPALPPADIGTLAPDFDALAQAAPVAQADAEAGRESAPSAAK